jgi:hypothetical protein
MLIIDATGLPRLMECNGSRLMPPSFPTVDDPTARDEGTAAHYMAQQIFSGAFTIEELMDRKAPNGFYMTHEMGEYVDKLSCGARLVRFMEIDTSWGDGVNSALTVALIMSHMLPISIRYISMISNMVSDWLNRNEIGR